MLVSGIMGLATTLIDRLVPNKNQKEKALAELKILETTGELDLLAKQLEVNKVEAGHRSLFVAGWRPSIGWICSIAFAYHFVLQPLIVFVAALNGTVIDLPEFDASAMITVLLGMLGLGGFRTFEKLKGISK